MFSSRKSSAPVSGGYTLSKSLRFRSSASAYLNRTPSSASNQKTWTLSAWVKRGNLSASQTLMSQGDTYVDLNNGSDQIEINLRTGGTNYLLTSTAIYKDVSAWYHIVVACDTTNATAADRLKLWVNNVQIINYVYNPAPYTSIPQNQNTGFNAASVHRIGASTTYGEYFGGYMAEVNFIDGQALTPSSFGATNATTGQWSPATYSGTYGTNGFHLTFANTTSTTTLGYDTSGNSNNWTTNNISLTAGRTYDSMNDVPVAYSATAANYAVFNPIGGVSNPSTITDGNLYVTTPATGIGTTVSTIQIPSSGQYYCEITFVTDGASAEIGIVDFATINTNFPLSPNCVTYASSGVKFIDGSSSSYGSSYTTGDIIGLAINANTGSITFYKNNTSQGAITHAVAGLVIAVGDGSNGAGGSVFAGNFGQQPFTYTPPSGYKALNTYNLPTPTIAQGNKYMAATTFTSVSGSNAVVNTVNGVGFQPDLVWIKARSNAQDHYDIDSVRGGNYLLRPNQTYADSTASYWIDSFNSNGFTTNTTNLLSVGYTYVGWQWQAGAGSSSSNTNGTITSTVSANTTAGFSIVTYTGNGTAGATIGHGLGVTPSMVIVKCRSNAATNWATWQTTLLGSEFLYLNSTAAKGTGNTSLWNGTIPSSTVISVGFDNDTNASTRTYVAYCFAAVAGFSSFGSYTGNGSTSGPFIYCGFQPKFIMTKRTNTTGDWLMWDTTRNPYNGLQLNLWANYDLAENNYGSGIWNVYSNGMQPTSSSIVCNNSGDTYIYMAFASNPFKYSNAF